MVASKMAENLIGSEIIKLAGEIREKVAAGATIYNFTIGDFDPKMFPIPAELKQAILDYYARNDTNYPEANGMTVLRQAIAAFLKKQGNYDYTPNEILVSAGARPIIYSIYRALIDEGDKVVYPVPSWNNNHYVHMTGASQVFVETKPEHNFMPVASELKEHLNDAVLLALCSPLNPTGTVFSKTQLEEICDLVLEINENRPNGAKPLYVLYDQIYWALTYSGCEHVDPVRLRPAMKSYTIYVDGISKSLAATGVRVGWAMGPAPIIDKMKNILNHVGAWSPKPEQLGTADFLNNQTAYTNFTKAFKEEIFKRLTGVYDVFNRLKTDGYRVTAIKPMAAIYLTVQFDLKGACLPDGRILKTTRDVTQFILDDAGIALVPFNAFGADGESSWYRLSVGTCKLDDIEKVYQNLKRSLAKLKN
ncbi:MAG TPA: aminotransferase class I/II-fold pyridoxal phosphate-dependent enzyme [Flavobacteriales bacterium]|nr:aminotransferase class I/II-fold pyridoxal phosphate-dependent enzyme [Flavobacteriales bacterium]